MKMARIGEPEIGNPLFFPRESPLVNALYKAYVGCDWRHGEQNQW